eukprot:108686_1
MTAQCYIHFTLFIIVIQWLSLCYSVFTIGSKRLPRATYSLNIAYDAPNDRILLIGGKSHRRQLVLFKNHDFISDDETYLSSSQETYANGQMNAVHRNYLWSTKYYGEYYVKFDLTTYQAEVPSVNLPVALTPQNSLCSIDGYLFHFDGGSSADSDAAFQIYRFSDAQWLSNVPSLDKPRGGAACVVVDNKMYLIGGDDANSNDLKTIEVLDVSDIDLGASWTSSWYYFGDTLTGAARRKLRAAVHGTIIYVVGGENSDGDGVSDLTIIDTVAGQCSAGDSLSYPVAAAACIVVENILYVFGGFGSGGDSDVEDRYQYMAVPPLETNDPTKPPTNDPSKRPTSHPTKRPSPNPTKRPTSNPSQRPTPNPTKRQTNNPSKRPTSNPSQRPTGKPSTPPTDNPSQPPTDHPSKPPTSNPSRAPTGDPSSAPTKRPTRNPTPKPTTGSPTQPGTMTCDASTVGLYSNAGEQLIVEVSMPFAGELIFDASISNFAIAGIDVQTKLGGNLGSDSDHDGIVSLNPVVVGDYKFVLMSDSTGIYHVQIGCVSDEPTVFPTQSPTQYPTKRPSYAPVNHPARAEPSVSPVTSKPTTAIPTVLPTDGPTDRPTCKTP